MNRADILKIIEDPAHPMRPEIAALVSALFSSGMFAICFGMSLDPVPGDTRRAKASDMLAGMLTGESDGTATVTAFIKNNPSSFSLSFFPLLSAARAESVRLAGAPQAECPAGPNNIP
jgi:hypothetical protein